MANPSDALGAAGAILLRATESVPGDTTATQAAWVSVFAVLGGVVTACTIAVIVWKVAKPHVDMYVRSLIAPLQDTADATHRQVSVNGGKNNPPTLLDEVGAVKADVAAVRREVGEIRTLAEATAAAQQAHEAESGRYLGHVSLVLSEHGITIPLPSDAEDQ